MKITGNIWAKKIKEEHPGAIKGQLSGTVEYNEKRGRLKISISHRDFLELVKESEGELGQQFYEEIDSCEYPDLWEHLDEDDFDLEVDDNA